MSNNKSEFNRHNLKDNFLKQVLFRIDYNGIVDITPIISAFNNEFKPKIDSYETTFHNRIDLDLQSLEDISETLAVPVKVLEKQTIHRYALKTSGNSDVTLDISRFYTTLTVKCKDYTIIDEYMNFLNNFILFMFKENNFFEIQRVALRKLGEIVVANYNDLFSVFEKDVFCSNAALNDLYSTSMLNNLSVIRPNGKDETVNYNRRIQEGYVTDVDGKESKAYQAVLDMDCFLKDDSLDSVNESNNAADILKNMNNILFFVYLLSVTYDYLKGKKKEDE